MPIYAYRCTTCGFAKDALQKLSDPVLTECPSCHAQTFQKQVTAAGFQLKGSGWYATDFRNPPEKAKPAVPDAAGADGAKKDDSSTGASSPPASGATPAGGGAAAAKPTLPSKSDSPAVSAPGAASGSSAGSSTSSGSH